MNVSNEMSVQAGVNQSPTFRRTNVLFLNVISFELFRGTGGEMRKYFNEKYKKLIIRET